MIRYATERFLDIEIIVSGKSGIKVPVSAEPRTNSIRYLKNTS